MTLDWTVLPNKIADEVIARVAPKAVTIIKAYGRTPHASAMLQSAVHAQVIRQVKVRVRQMYPSFVVSRDPQVARSSNFAFLDARESDLRDESYLKAISRLVSDPKKFDYPIVRKILEIEKRTCDARLGAAGATESKELRKRSRAAREILSELSRSSITQPAGKGQKTVFAVSEESSRHPIFADPKFASRLAKEIRQYGIDNAPLPEDIRGLALEASKLVEKRMPELSAAIKSSMAQKRAREERREK